MIRDQDTPTGAHGEDRTNVIAFTKVSPPALMTHLALPAESALRYPVFSRVVDGFMPSGGKGCKARTRYTFQSLRLGFPLSVSDPATTKYAREMELFLRARCGACNKRKCRARAEIHGARGVQ